MHGLPAVLRHVFGAVVLFTLSGAAAEAEFGQRVPVERRLPPNVAYFSTIRDVKKFHECARETSCGQLWADPQFRTWTPAGFGTQTIASVIEPQLKLASSIIEEWCGIRVDAICESINGEAAVAVVSDGDNEPGVAWFFELGDKAQEIGDKGEWIAKFLCDETARKSESKVRGTRCVTLESTQAKDPLRCRRLAYFTKDSYLVLATSAEILTSILERWDGKHENTLAVDETFCAIAELADWEAINGGSEMIWFSRGSDELILRANLQVCLQKLIAIGNCPLLMLESIDDERCSAYFAQTVGRDSPVDTGGVFSPLGNGCDLLCRTVACRVAPDRMLADARVHRSKGEKLESATTETGEGDDKHPLSVGRELLPRQTLREPPQWIHGNVRRVCGFHWDLESVMKTIWPAEWLADCWKRGDVLDDFQVVLHLAQEHAAPGIAGSLSGATWLVETPETSDGARKASVALALEVVDEQSLQRIIEKLQSAGAVSRDTKSAGIHAVWQINVDRGWIWKRKERLKNLMTIAHGHLIFGDSIGALNSLIEAEPGIPALADHPEYNALMTRVPETSLVVEYSRVPTASEFAEDWALDSTNSAAKSTAGKMPPDDAGRVESLAKHLTMEASYIAGDQTSMRRTFVRLRRSK